MCRFLMIKAGAPFETRPWLESFADMSEASRAPDGDRQADGWGAAWRDENGVWRVVKSIAPVWTEREAFSNVPDSRILVVHARSASFPGQKGVLDYSQPFVDGRHAFVFNGLLKGVALPSRNGDGIGSQKIWAILSNFLERDTPVRSLSRLAEVLEKRSREVSALNVGLSDGDKLYAYCTYTDYPDYYNLQVAEGSGFSAVCSDPLPGEDFRPAPTRTVIEF